MKNRYQRLIQVESIQYIAHNYYYSIYYSYRIWSSHCDPDADDEHYGVFDVNHHIDASQVGPTGAGFKEIITNTYSDA